MDDELTNVILLERILERKGYPNISSTTEPLKVIELFRSSDPDILLLDLRMPGLDGFQVMAELAATFPDHYVPILVLTADATRETMARALSHGASDFLTKPFDANEVLLRISNLLLTRYHRLYLDEQVRQRTSELEAANASLLSMQQVAEAASRAKNEFITNISHELQTPLNGILALSTLLEREAVDVRSAQMLSMIGKSSSQLSRLLGDVVDIASHDAGRADVANQSLNILQLTEQVIELYRVEAFSKGILLEFKPPTPEPPIVICDAIRLRQTLCCLVSNAVKFTKAGTVAVEILWEERDSSIQIAMLVNDTGIGIAEQDFDRIFEDFTQINQSTSRPFEGTGLGLAIVRRNIERMNGSISLESQVGKGSTFRFTLRLRPANSILRPLTGAQKRVPLMGVTTPRILVVEDNHVNLIVLTEILQKFHCEVETAENGLRAIAKASNSNFDLILMDIQMPVCDGVEATREIRRINREQGLPQIPIIAITANARLEDLPNYYEAGIDEVFPKPVSFESVGTCLANLGWNYDQS